MRIASALLSFSLCLPLAYAQTPAPSPASISEGVQPALASLETAVSAVRVDKWKLSGALRDETSGNLESIKRDIDATLPKLLASADTKPVMLSRVLPASRNIDALYNVLLRVAATAKVSAPSEQTAALENAVAQLQDVRRVLEERIQAYTVAQEKHIADLQAALKSSQDAVAKAQADAAAAEAAAKKPAKKKSTRSTKKPVTK